MLDVSWSFSSVLGGCFALQLHYSKDELLYLSLIGVELVPNLIVELEEMPILFVDDFIQLFTLLYVD